MNRSITRIPAEDFDGLVSALAAAIWNHLIEKPSFQSATLNLYADIFEAVAESLKPYHSGNSKPQRRKS